MLDANSPATPDGQMIERLGIKEKDGLAQAIQEKIRLVGNVADAKVAGLVQELGGYLAELSAHCDSDRKAVISRRVDKIFADLGTVSET